MKKALVILGPTATGKTDLALKLAKEFIGEIIACDSRQVYKGLDIGTGKLPGSVGECKKHKGYWEVNGVSKAHASALKIWMYDLVDLNQRFTVYDFVNQAIKVVDDISSGGKLPIIVGGTGLYLKALLEGLPNLSIPENPELRQELESLSLEKLQKRLKKLSEDKWNSLNNSDKGNIRRLLRSIELILMNPYMDNHQIPNLNDQNYDILKIGLTAPREALYKKINSRVFDWLNLGILQEVEDLIKSGIDEKKISEIGLEYRVIVNFLKGHMSSGELVDKMQTKVRQYAKRQITWFKKERDIFWFDIADINYLKEVEKQVAFWYH